MDNLDLLGGYGGNAYAGNPFASEALPEFVFFSTNITMEGLTLSSDVDLIIGGTLSTTLDDMTIAADAGVLVSASLNETLDGLSLSSVAAVFYVTDRIFATSFDPVAVFDVEDERAVFDVEDPLTIFEVL